MSGAPNKTTLHFSFLDGRTSALQQASLDKGHCTENKKEKPLLRSHCRQCNHLYDITKKLGNKAPQKK
jgi:hypothetical protein